MSSIFIFVLLVAVISQYASVKGNNEWLEHLIVTYRTQEHTPVDYFNELTISGTKEVNGQLTEKGREDAFGLGRDLAIKYGPQLGVTEEWDKENFWSYGSNSQNSKLASLLVGAGLINDERGSSIEYSDKEIKSATYSATEQFMKFMKRNECQGFFKLLKKMEIHLKSLRMKYQNAVDALENKYSDVKKASYLPWTAYETLQALENVNNTVDPGIKPYLSDLKKLSQEILYKILSTDTVKKLAGGRILDDILEYMQDIVDGKPIKRYPKDGNQIKATFFGTSQMLVAAQLAAFNPQGTKYGNEYLKPESFYPEEGAVHLIEMHKGDDGWKIKVLYRQKEDFDYKEAKFPGCDSSQNSGCDFDQFKKSVEILRLSKKQLEKECKKK